jgi:hypothetical protein
MNAPLPFQSTLRRREPAIDLVRLAQLVDLELVEFEREAGGEAGESGQQALRGLAVIWVALFAPESLTQVVVQRWCGSQVGERADVSEQTRLLFAAVRVALLDDLDALSEVCEAAGARASGLRRVAQQALVLLAPRLPLEHDALQAWAHGRMRQGGEEADRAVAVMLASAGSELARREWLAHSIRRIPRLAQDPFAAAQLAGQPWPNTVAWPMLAEIDHWVLARLASVLPPMAEQMSLDLPGQAQDVRDVRTSTRRALFRQGAIPRLPLPALLQRLQAHPLAAPLVRLLPPEATAAKSHMDACDFAS